MISMWFSALKSVLSFFEGLMSTLWTSIMSDPILASFVALDVIMIILYFAHNVGTDN